MNAVEIWMQNSEHQADQITKAFLSTTSLSDLLMNIAMIGILPALGEELLFRGLSSNYLKINLGMRMLRSGSRLPYSAPCICSFLDSSRLVLGAMFDICSNGAVLYGYRFLHIF